MLKYVIIALIIILIFASSYEATRVSVQEGERAKLEFQYPCESTKVTLQRANGAPFYSSEHPDVISESNKIVTNQKGNDTCSLNLTINPVSRHDEGTYISIAYKNGRMIYPQEDGRIWLHVDYPPGKVSCEISGDHIPGEWLKLQCTVSSGTKAGQIVCYQNDKRLPQLSSPHENYRTVDQTILARIVDPVYCCSSVLAKTKERCECKDWGWDPDLDILLSNTDPCATTSTAHSSTSSPDPGKDITTATQTSIPPLHVITEKNPHPPQKVDFKMMFVIVAVFFGLSIIIIIIKIYQSNSERPSKPPEQDIELGDKFCDYQGDHDKPHEHFI